jgi:hypothetical protein
VTAAVVIGTTSSVVATMIGAILVIAALLNLACIAFYAWRTRKHAFYHNSTWDEKKLRSTMSRVPSIWRPWDPLSFDCVTWRDGDCEVRMQRLNGKPVPMDAVDLLRSTLEWREVQDEYHRLCLEFAMEGSHGSH